MDELLAGKNGQDEKQHNKHNGKGIKELLDAAENEGVAQMTHENCFV